MGAGFGAPSFVAGGFSASAARGAAPNTENAAAAGIPPRGDPADGRPAGRLRGAGDLDGGFELSNAPPRPEEQRFRFDSADSIGLDLPPGEMRSEFNPRPQGNSLSRMRPRKAWPR